jgi:hypothetical protein
MSIRQLLIDINITDTTIDCDGNDVEEVKAIVAITTDGQPSTYAVSLWDHNFFFADRQLSDRIVENIPAMDPSNDYRKVHYFSLSCDDQCHVKGNSGSAGEEKADVYAYSEEWNSLLGQQVQEGEAQASRTIRVRCVRSQRRTNPK